MIADNFIQLLAFVARKTLRIMLAIEAVKNTRKLLARYLLSHIMRYKQLHLMVLPAIIWLVLFRYFPIYGITMAFQKFSLRKGFFGSKFVGLKHFEWLFRNPTFMQAFINTWLINLGKLALGTFSTILLALLLNEIRHIAYKRSIQTITYLPHFISWVILAGIFSSPIFFAVSFTTTFLSGVSRDAPHL